MVYGNHIFSWLKIKTLRLGRHLSLPHAILAHYKEKWIPSQVYKVSVFYFFIVTMTSSDLLFRTLKKLYQFSILALNHVKTNRCRRCRKNWSLTCCRRLRDVPDLQVTRLPLQSPQKVPQWRPASVPKLFPTWFASPGLRNPFWTRSLLSFWVILGWF